VQESRHPKEQNPQCESEIRITTCPLISRAAVLSPAGFAEGLFFLRVKKDRCKSKNKSVYEQLSESCKRIENMNKAG
jgi:hypothetical protein